MRLATIVLDQRAAAVALADGMASRIDAPSLEAAVASAPDPSTWTLGATIPVGKADVLAPLRPGKIVAIGLNYADHVRETGLEAPKAPLVFAKFPGSVTGPSAPIALPRVAPEQVDWEVELAVVIGRRMRDVAVEHALEHVLGYTVANDVSARDVQFEDVQWTRGKSFDGFCPLGPVVVTPDELGDPQRLALRTRVNGEIVQDSSTSEMIFGVAELLSYCSRSFSLNPGDVVLTGTPWGCGGFSTPKRFLRAGDVVECEVEGIGILRNDVIASDRRGL
jgi:2-keto-4-pentenoate hydratase/2-oxohepta-3-ene-1,7-dioic acid hydratase in catechol pathway